MSSASHARDVDARGRASCTPGRRPAARQTADGAVAGGRTRHGLAPPREYVVVRPRLLDLLERGAQRPLTLISAPAGSGKTVAVATWAEYHPGSGPIVCVSLTELDVRAGMPWSMISAELARAGVRVRDIVGTDGASITAISAAIVNHPQPVTLILDCAAELPPSTTRGLDQLLAEASERLRLILLTRCDPALPLHRYRLAEALVEIRLADLAFTSAEADELFTRRGLELSREDLELVVARTRGWAAGLILAAMTLTGSQDPGRAVRDFSGESAPVAEYLLAEVLNVQAPHTRDLLLRTSVADTLRPGLIQALAGDDAEAALEQLASGNALVERVSGRRGSYRYHPLFRELLRAQLTFEAPDEARRLHLIAAEWLGNAGLLVEAVNCAVQADAWEVAAAFVVEGLAFADLLTPNAALQELLADMPGETDGLAAAIVRATLAASRGRRDAAVHLRRARVLTAVETPKPAAALTLAIVSALAAAQAEDDDAVLNAVFEAEQLLAEHSATLSPSPEPLIILGTAKARALLSRGPLTAAVTACNEVVVRGMRPGFQREHVECLSYLALIAAWRGSNRRTVRLARQAFALAARADLAPAAGSAAVAETSLAWVCVETNDIAQARQHAETAEAAIDATTARAARIALTLVAARIRRVSGDPQGARASLSATRRRVDELPPWLRTLIVAEEAVIASLLAESGPADPPPGAEWESGTLAAQANGWLRRAQGQVNRGDQGHALQSVDRALQLAAPERLRRPFLDAPTEVRRLMRASGDLARRHPWLGLDVDAAGLPKPAAEQAWKRSAVAAPPVVAEPLTDKEREVLGHLAQLLTTEEIAGAMFVSVNTIRTHVRNILRKLGATRRNEAIRRAREIGILAS